MQQAGDDAPRPADAVEVGRIVGPWGIQGAVKVLAFSSQPQALFSSRRWFLEPPLPQPGAAVRAPGADIPRLLRITQAREHGDAIVARAQEVPDRTAAERLAGWRVFVSRASFPTPGEGEFYWVDLIGLEVLNREGVRLGRVDTLIETGPHCVLRILDETPDGAAEAGKPHERLIPFVDAYVDAVDLPGRCIRVDWDPAD